MQTGLFILQDPNDSFLINCKIDKESNGFISDWLKGSNTSNKKDTGFISTLVGITNDQGFLQQVESVPQNSTPDDAITDKFQFVDLWQRFEGKTKNPVTSEGVLDDRTKTDAGPKLGPLTGQIEPDQAGSTIDEDSTNPNKYIKVSSLFSEANKGFQKLDSPLLSSDHTVLKEGEKNAIRASSLPNHQVEDGLKLKSAVPFANDTIKNSVENLWNKNIGQDVRSDSDSRVGQLELGKNGSGIIKGHTASNDSFRMACLFDMTHEDGKTFKSALHPPDHAQEKASAYSIEIVGSEKPLLLKSRMDFQGPAEYLDKEILVPGKNLVSGDVNHGEKLTDFNITSEVDNKYAWHISKDLPFEGFIGKSNFCQQDFDAIARKFDVFYKDIADNRVAGIDASSRENALSFSDSQPQDKIPETVTPAKSTEILEKPLQIGILKQLVDKAAVNLKSGKSSIKINLKPEYLGRLRMDISTEKHHVMLKIMTEIPIVKEIIENNIHQLRAALQTHGLQIDDFNVSVAHDSDQHADTYENTKFSSRGNNASEDEVRDLLPGEDDVRHSPEGSPGETLIDYFA